MSAPPRPTCKALLDASPGAVAWPSADRSGLSAAEARERLARFGPNELPRQQKRTAWKIALEVLREPMLAMLLAAGGVYLLLGESSEAVILLLFACFSILITIVQEARTENVLASLRDLSAPRALVVRDGSPIRIAGREVVEGDLLVVEQGDRIAADALLLEARELGCDESLLTGESVPVRKRAATAGDQADAEPGGEDKPHIYAGSIVTQGGGMALVTATGLRSRIGQIGQSLSTLETTAPRLQRETGRIVRLCAAGGLGVAALVVLLFGLARGEWLDALLAGIAIGMSLLPEEFPVVLTVFLAMGAWRIAQVGVLTRRASAIETMGAVTVLCTDKTGTLTQNRMAVAALWLPDGAAESAKQAAGDPRFHGLLRHGALASAPVPVDPMEVAFHEAASGVAQSGREDWTLLHTTGLRPDLLAVSNVWRTADDRAPLQVSAKGAPEAIAQLCRLDGAARERLDEAARAMAARGLRVLGVAAADTVPAKVAEDHRAHAFVLLGLVGLHDPLRSGVQDAVMQARRAGIRIVMITGDYAATARAIAAEAGLPDGDVLTGADVAALSDEELAERMRSVTICARTMPDQKLRIVMALEAASEVVAMTGDGVNDAPALKAAHVGVAMGRRGTDVAREAASIVLVEDDFGAIISAVRLGRRIYDNIRKAVGFIFSVHVPIAGLALLPLPLGLPIVLGPIQIALLEMIIDPVCALVFEAEREERNLMERPPRSPQERLFSAPLVIRSVVQGAIALLLLTLALLAARAMAMPFAEIRTLAFFALVAAVMAMIFAYRSYSAKPSHAVVRHNVTFRYVLAAVVIGAVALLKIDYMRNWLGFASLGWPAIGLAAGTGVALFLLFELGKWMFPPMQPNGGAAL